MRQIETITQLREILCDERIRLEGDLAGRRSMLDRIISLIDSAAARPAGETTCTETLPAKSVPTAPPESKRVTGPGTTAVGNGKPGTPNPSPRQPRRARATARAGSTADQVRTWIAGHGEEFKVSDLVKHTGGLASAVACAIQKLAAAGKIIRTGYGRYQRGPKFEAAVASPVAAQYAQFRESLGDLHVPEISPGLGGREA